MPWESKCGLVFGFEGSHTSTGEKILQQHQVHGTGAAWRSVTLGNADMGAPTIITRARVGRCREDMELSITTTDAAYNYHRINCIVLVCRLTGFIR